MNSRDISEIESELQAVMAKRDAMLIHTKEELTVLRAELDKAHGDAVAQKHLDSAGPDEIEYLKAALASTS